MNISSEWAFLCAGVLEHKPDIFKKNKPQWAISEDVHDRGNLRVNK